MSNITIGIDLGTTYSCVSAFTENKHVIIKTEDGANTMASFVSFTNNGRVIGNEAKEMCVPNAESTLFDMKRIIGRSFIDEILQENIENLPFKVVNDNGEVKIEIQRNNSKTLYYPQEISAMILQKLKENAERHFKTNIKKAVISVPAHFNNFQRQATIDAGKIAGLEVLRIINEPTAAVLAYGLDKRYKKEYMVGNVLIYDFGGGRFDVSIISVDDGLFEVKATDGCTNLGGNDIDILLLNHFVNEFKATCNKDITTDKRVLRRLLVQCEKLKIVLSSADGAIIEIDDLYDGCDFRSKIMKTDFEEMCHDIFKKTLECVENVFDAAKLSVNDIHEVFLVGGSTRIPKVQELVKTFFGGKELNTSLNSDEVVAIGASVHAAILARDNSDIVGGFFLMDVISLPLVIVEAEHKINVVIIPQNTQIPAKLIHTYCPIYKSPEVKIYEGKQKNVRLNHLLYIISNFTVRKCCKTEILITFDLNTDGILHVTAMQRKKGKTDITPVNIDYSIHQLSENGIKSMIEEARRLKEDDAKLAKNVNARLNLEEYCNKTLERLKTFIGVISDEHKNIIETNCNSTMEWILENMYGQEEDYKMKEKEVYIACNPIISKYL